jgi:hypothetical protein
VIISCSGVAPPGQGPPGPSTLRRKNQKAAAAVNENQ